MYAAYSQKIVCANVCVCVCVCVSVSIDRGKNKYDKSNVAKS